MIGCRSTTVNRPAEIWNSIVSRMTLTRSIPADSDRFGELGRRSLFGRGVAQGSRWVWYLYWLPLIGAALFWCLSPTLVHSDRQQNRAINMIVKLDRYAQLVAATDAGRLLIELRLLLPELALLDPRGQSTIRENIDALEREFVASIGEPSVRESVIRELDKLHHAMVLMTTPAWCAERNHETRSSRCSGCSA